MNERIGSSLLRDVLAAAVLCGAGPAIGPVLATGSQVPPFAQPPVARAAAPVALPDRSLRPAYLHVFPAESEPYGRSYAEWVVEWLQYGFTMPTAADPSDPGGTYCMAGQRGPVWMPVGNPGATACRTVPADRAIIIGFAQINFNTPDVCGQVGSLSARELRDQLALNLDPAVISIRIDGAVVPNPTNRFRVRTPVFSVALPADNIVNQYCAATDLIPAGVYSPAVGDGVVVVVPPLRPGPHVLHVHADVPAQGWNLDYEFQLEVVPVSRH